MKILYEKGLRVRRFDSEGPDWGSITLVGPRAEIQAAAMLARQGPVSIVAAIKADIDDASVAATITGLGGA